VYDSAASLTIVFGGYGYTQYRNETLTWDGENWSQLAPIDSPSHRAYHAMVYDETRDVTLLFGGSNGDNLDDTWEFDGENWIQQFPVTMPFYRMHHGMVYDGSRGAALLFGGITISGNVGDTWEYPRILHEIFLPAVQQDGI